MSWTWWRYPKRRFQVETTTYTVRMYARGDGLCSRLENEAGEILAEDKTPITGTEAVRNHRLSYLLPDGRLLMVDAGYVSLWMTGIAVRLENELIHQSHPDRTISYPEKYREAACSLEGKTASGLLKEGWAEGSRRQGIDFKVLKRNRVPIAVDLAMGINFYTVAKLTDLPTAALVAAALGIGLVIVQRFVKVDLVGGLALFGVILALVSAGLALTFQDDLAIKLRNALLGLVGALLFLCDGLFLKGRRLGQGLMRYLPYTNLDPPRLSLAMAAMGAVMAGISAAVAYYASTDFWLLYNVFGDFIVAFVLIQFAIAYAKRPHPPPS